METTIRAPLSQAESERFKKKQANLRYSNSSQGEWRAVRSLADNRSIA